MSATCPRNNPAVDLELTHALLDAQLHCREYGQPVQIRVRDEGNITRDDYKSIRRRSTVMDLDRTFYAFPVEYSPSQRKLEKGGLKESSDVMIYTARQDWLDESLDFEQIDMTRTSVIIEGTTFEIREKSRVNQIGTGFVYISFGLVRR